MWLSVTIDENQSHTKIWLDSIIPIPWLELISPSLLFDLISFSILYNLIEYYSFPRFDYFDSAIITFTFHTDIVKDSPIHIPENMLG